MLGFSNSEIDNFHIYENASVFRIRAIEEIKRARRYATFVSLITIDLSHIDQLGDMEKFSNFEDFMSSLCSFVGKSVRETDLISSTSNRQILILLVETPLEGAMVVSKRLKKTIRYFLCDNIKSPINWRVPMKEYNFPSAPGENGGIMAVLDNADSQ